MAASAFAREQLWDGLRAVALPDSRFHMRFSEFIPDFSGSDTAIETAVAEASLELADSGRVLLRPSGTEPMVRVMVEAADQATADRLAHAIADVVKAELGQ